MNYDPKTKELAEHFLGPDACKPAFVDSLAQDIQQAVDKWFEDHLIKGPVVSTPVYGIE